MLSPLATVGVLLLLLSSLGSLGAANATAPPPGSVAALAVPAITPGTPICQGSLGASSFSTTAFSVLTGAAIFATVWLSSGSSTLSYTAGTYHGSLVLITSAAGASWQGWFYAQALTASSSFVLTANSTSAAPIGIGAEVLSPTSTGSAVLFDASGPVGTTTMTQVTASVTTTQLPDWVGLGYSDNDGSQDVSVGTGESVLSDCNVPSQNIYTGIIDRTNSVGYVGSVTLTANVSNYGSALAAGFYTSGGALTLSSFTASPAGISLGQTSTLSAIAYGGTAPYTYAYAGLPPGCPSSNSASLSCAPGQAGSFEIRTYVNDSASATVTGTTNLSVAPLTQYCGGSALASSFTAGPIGISAGSALYGEVFLGSGTATVTYTAGTYHGAMTVLLTATGGNWGGWFYAEALPASSGLSVTINATANVPIGVALDLLAPTVGGDQVVLDSSGPLSAGNIAQFSAYTTTSHTPDWVEMGYSDNDGSPDVGVGVGETVQSDCNVPTQGIYMGTINRSAPLGFAGTVTLWANTTNYGSGQVAAFYQMTPGAPLTVTSFGVSPTVVYVGTTATFSMSLSGGLPPYSYTYTDLPPGCTSANVPTLACTPTAVGSFSVRGYGNDTSAHSASALTTLLVVSPLLSVSISPTSGAVLVGGSQTFSAVPSCAGGVCPAGTTYSWTLTNTLGTLSSATAASPTFTAGALTGTDTLFVNATLDLATFQSAGASITISPGALPTLSSVSVTPASYTLAFGASAAFAATPSCTGGVCPSGTIYRWSLTNGLGSLSVNTADPVTFTAGGIAGQDTLFVNATLNGVTVEGNPVTITMQSTVTSPLLGVSVAPTSVTLATGGTKVITATPSCSGGSCPNGISYVWSLSNTIGGVSPTTGTLTQFTAGSQAGTAVLTVVATLSGTSREANATITVQSSSSPPTPPAAPTNGFLGLPGDQGLYLLLVLLVLAVMVGAVLVTFGRRRAPGAQPPVTWGVPPPPPTAATLPPSAVLPPAGRAPPPMGGAPPPPP